MRQTKIVATVGPACNTASSLKRLIAEGVDMFRINASHIVPEELEAWVKLIRSATRTAKVPVPILVDLQGPRVRTGRLSDGRPVELKKGAKTTIEVGFGEGDAKHLKTTCREFPEMVSNGDQVLLDNGTITLKVLSVQGKTVECEVVVGGVLGENKGINLPSAPVSLPALTAKDKADLGMAVKCGVDYIALSFVRSGEDLLSIKSWMKRKNAEIPVIAKIEKPSAVECIEDILDHAGGIMVARGDLGIEMGVEKVPAVQKRLIQVANKRNLPVITATQMLETMIERPQPTRAEVSDIANAVFDGTDAVMLSGETAVGKYALDAVRMMATIIREAENTVQAPPKVFEDMGFGPHQIEPIHAITHAAYNAARALKVKAVMLFTRSGRTARLISKLRPGCPIFVLVSKPELASRLCLLRGVTPLVIRSSAGTDQTIRNGDRALLKYGLLKKGDLVVMVSGKLALPGLRFMTKIHPIGER